MPVMRRPLHKNGRRIASAPVHRATTT